MESQKENSQSTFQDAQKSLLRWIAVRDHTPKEIRQKMQDKFEVQVIEDVITWAGNKGLLPNDAASQILRSQEISENLGRKGKGQDFINKKLEALGLPVPHVNPELELEKARALVETKFSGIDLEDPTQKAKAFRFLMGRGFNPDTVQQVLKGMEDGFTHEF